MGLIRKLTNIWILQPNVKSLKSTYDILNSSICSYEEPSRYLYFVSRKVLESNIQLNIK